MLVVAIVALREPKGHVSGTTTGRTVVKTLTPTPTSSGASTTRPSSSSSSSASSSTSTAAVGVKAVPLVVLNDSTVGGLARTAAQRFEQGGWQVTRFDNLPGSITDIVSTCAYYDPSVPNARAAAQALQQEYPTIQRVKEKFAELPAGAVVVVLTSGYSTG